METTNTQKIEQAIVCLQIALSLTDAKNKLNREKMLRQALDLLKGIADD